MGLFLQSTYKRDVHGWAFSAALVHVQLKWLFIVTGQMLKSPAPENATVSVEVQLPVYIKYIHVFMASSR